MSNLEQEFDYYLKNKDEFLKQYENKYLVIKDKTVVGTYDSELEAYKFASEKYENGSYLIQPCTRDDGSLTQTFYSRVAF
jgi:hypothetical protein